MPHDRGSGPYKDGKPVTYESRHQRVENESWPERDQDGNWHARNIREQPAANHVDVEVRCVFAVDGECWVPGRATRWTASHVMIDVNDERVIGRKLWVEAGDVRRV